jgi:hypothetical protein
VIAAAKRIAREIDIGFFVVAVSAKCLGDARARQMAA